MMFVPRVDFRSFEIGMHTAYLLVSYRLDLRETAVDEQFRSRYVAAIVTGEKYRDLRDLIGCSRISAHVNSTFGSALYPVGAASNPCCHASATSVDAFSVTIHAISLS